MLLFENFMVYENAENDELQVFHNGRLFAGYDIETRKWKRHGGCLPFEIMKEFLNEPSESLVAEATGKKKIQNYEEFSGLLGEPVTVADMLDDFRVRFEQKLADSYLLWYIQGILSEAFSEKHAFRTFDRFLEAMEGNEFDLADISAISVAETGRDLLVHRVRINDKPWWGSSFFNIQPAKFYDSDAKWLRDRFILFGLCISIEMDDVLQYLWPFLEKRFDDGLTVNLNRNDPDYDCNGFEWSGRVPNFFTLGQMRDILSEIHALLTDVENGISSPLFEDIRIIKGTFVELAYAPGMSQEEIDAYNRRQREERKEDADVVVDFYKRFLFRMEYMVKIAEENGYDLISFIGP